MQSMNNRDTIIELEQLRAAIARGTASEATQASFYELACSLSWPTEQGTSLTPSPISPPLDAGAKSPPLPALGFLGKEMTGLTCDIQLRLSHVPLALVHAFDESLDPIATVTVENSGPKARRLRIKSWVDGYSAQSVAVVELGPNTGKDDPTKPNWLAPRASVPILPTFFQERLDGHAHPVRATLHVEVSELGEGSGPRVEEHRTLRLWLLPRTTTVLWQADPATGKQRVMTKHLASWVTPDAPEVMDALRDSTKHVAGNQIISYQMANAQVEAQVKAIFTTLKERELTYVNSTVATGSSGAFVQRIRLPADSLRTRSSNCVDGAVLYASLIEAASLRAAIVLVPGHAFVAWRPSRKTGPDGAPIYGDWSFLETTMTMSESFERACEAASATYKLHHANGRATILDVQELRAAGYLPIG